MWSRSLAIVLTACLLFVLPADVAAQTNAPPTADTAGGTTSPGGPPGATPAPMPITAEIPAFHLTQVQLDAEVAADRINLVSTIEIVINHGEGWHRIPLRMGAAHVWKREYAGAGEEAPDVTPRPVDDGLSWMIRGLGKHQLKLYSWVPLKRTISGGQFQLTLPTLPAQFEARLHIRIPEANAVVRGAKNLIILDVNRENKQTQVEASVVGNLLYFAWQTPVAAGDAVSLVQSLLHLKPSAEHLSLVVDQSIELQQAALNELLIQLPLDFRLVQVSGQQYVAHEIIADRPGWVRVRLNTENPGRVTLRWILERELPTPGGALRLEGFRVEGAVREEGLIRIDEFENQRMVPRDRESQLVHRVDVNQVRSLGSGLPLTAYEFLKQPFRLAFDLEPTPPYFTVEPVHDLNFRDDLVDLTLTCPVQVERGAVSEVRLNWPGWMDEGWQVVSVSGDSDASRPVAYDVTSQPGQIRLWWPNAVSQNLVLTAVFRRELPDDFSQPITLSLPNPLSSETASAIVNVTAADHLTVSLSAADGHPLPSGADGTEAVEASTSGRSRGNASETYRLANVNRPFLAQIEAHHREITAATLVEILDADGDLVVDQKIELDVKYGRLGSVDLVIPPELLKLIPADSVTQALELTLAGQALPPMALMWNNDVLQVGFSAARKGLVELHVRYRFPIPADQPIRDIDLPVLSVSGQPFARAQCRIDVLDTVQVRANSAWEALRTSPSQGLWINSLKSGPGQNVVPLTVGRKLADVSQQYVVDKVQVRTIFASDGSAESWAEFQLDSPQSRLVVQFPPGTEFKDFFLDGQPLGSDAWTKRAGQEYDEIAITLPSRGGAHPRLGVRYRTQLDQAFGLTNRVTMPLPQFPRSVWVDETTWEMRLPEGHHLFTYPDLVPQFHWVRRFLFWHREPTSAYLAERAAAVDPGIPKEFLFPGRDFYAFQGFGPIQHISFRAMNRSLILLIGAGFTLLLGFMFWKLPATRNVFSLVVISFLFAAVSLWYVEPMLLLLQPAILGMVLALAATLIDSASHPLPPDQSKQRTPQAAPSEPEEDPSVRNLTTRIYRPVPAGKSDRVEG